MYLFIHLFIYLFIYWSIYFIYLFIYLFMHSVCIYIYILIHLYMTRPLFHFETDSPFIHQPLIRTLQVSSLSSSRSQVLIDSFSFRTGPSDEQLDPVEWRLEASNDQNTWKVLHSQDTMATWMAEEGHFLNSKLIDVGHFFEKTN